LTRLTVPLEREGPLLPWPFEGLLAGAAVLRVELERETPLERLAELPERVTALLERLTELLLPERLTPLERLAELPERLTELEPERLAELPERLTELPEDCTW